MPKKPSPAQPHPVPPDRAVHCAEALRLLEEARAGAQRDQVDLWDRAIELSLFIKAGITKHDLESLVKASLILPMDKATRPGDRRRTFRPSPQGRITKRTCFVLNAPAAAGFMASLTGVPAAEAKAQPGPKTNRGRKKEEPIPKWNRDWTLTFRGKVVMRFKRYASRVMPLLAHLEKLGWPEEVENILAVLSGPNPRPCLHNAINALNHRLKHSLIRFHPQGKTGIRWEDVSA